MFFQVIRGFTNTHDMSSCVTNILVWYDPILTNVSTAHEFISLCNSRVSNIHTTVNFSSSKSFTQCSTLHSLHTQPSFRLHVTRVRFVSELQAAITGNMLHYHTSNVYLPCVCNSRPPMPNTQTNVTFATRTYPILTRTRLFTSFIPSKSILLCTMW